MADFDAILRKALASRPNAPGEERRKIYERARQALIRQLTGFEPPLPPEDISRQRLALESAIRKVEADVAANGGVLPSAPAAPQAPVTPQAPHVAPTSASPAAPAVSAAPAMPAAPSMPATPTVPVAPAAPAIGSVAAAPERNSEPVAPRIEPLAVAVPDRDPDHPLDQPIGHAASVDDPAPSDLPDFQPERSQASTTKKGGLSGLAMGLIALVVLAGGGIAAWQTGMLDSYLGGDDSMAMSDGSQELLEEAPDVRTVGATDPTRSSERLLPDNQGTVVDEPVVLTPPSEAPDNGGEDVADETPVELTPANEELAVEDTQTAAVDPAPAGLPVAQSAILYEEGLTPEDNGFTAPGRTVWRLDESGDDPVIVGSIEVPDRGVSLDMRISRNPDPELPASHLIEFAFVFSEAFPAEGIAELVGVVVKPEEQAGGDPLRGAIVDLGEGVFWQALAAGEADLAVNLPLMRDGAWFDLPVLYADNRRAIITFEKGADGEAVFDQALAAWSN